MVYRGLMEEYQNRCGLLSYALKRAIASLDFGKNRLLLLFCILLGVHSIAFTQTRYVTANLNLRSGPGTGYRVLTVLPPGTEVAIDDDCNCKWLPVSYNGHVGYVRTAYLSKSCIRPNSGYGNHSYTKKYYGGVKYYRNKDGIKVQSPTYYKGRPNGATALCNDGTYSFSLNHRGTCSHHGGVAVWY